MTASDVLELIKKNLGSPWNESTYRDVFHAGDPKVEVKGIATTFMATLDLLQRAHAAGMNLVVTHETTFWNDRDDTKDMAGDAVYRFKVDFCAKNQMAVLRLHDHAHSHRPDFIMTGLLRALGLDRPARIRKTRGSSVPHHDSRRTGSRYTAKNQFEGISRRGRPEGKSQHRHGRHGVQYGAFLTGRGCGDHRREPGNRQRIRSHRVRVGRSVSGDKQGPDHSRSRYLGGTGDGGRRELAADVHP